VDKNRVVQPVIGIHEKERKELTRNRNGRIVKIKKRSETSRPSTHTKLERCSKKHKNKIIISNFVDCVYQHINYKSLLASD
jgi:hypothetical protein